MDDDDLFHGGSCGYESLHACVLGIAESLFNFGRCRGKYWTDQLFWEPRGLCRSFDFGLDQRVNKVLRVGLVCVGRFVGDVRGAPALYSSEHGNESDGSLERGFAFHVRVVREWLSLVIRADWVLDAPGNVSSVIADEFEGRRNLKRVCFRPISLAENASGKIFFLSICNDDFSFSCFSPRQFAKAFVPTTLMQPRIPFLFRA